MEEDFKVTCHKHFNVQHILIFKNKTVRTLKTSFRRYLSLSCLGPKKILDGLDPGTTGIYFLVLPCLVCYAQRWP